MGAVTVSPDDFIDEDALLTEEDKQKPDPASLKGIEIELYTSFICHNTPLTLVIYPKMDLKFKSKYIFYFFVAVCGTTGKRKACKDCSCGLAEELANENRPAGPPAGKSSCGSVNLHS